MNVWSGGSGRLTVLLSISFLLMSKNPRDMWNEVRIANSGGDPTFAVYLPLFEGAIHFLKADALSHHERNLRVMHMIFQAVGKGLKDYPPLLGPGELYALLEETIEIDPHGACRPRALKLSVDRNIRFTFQMLARLYETPMPDYSKGFGFLKNGSDIRNRITHPKVHNDVGISDAELAIIQKACQWTIDQFSAAVAEICKHLSNREKELISWVHTLDSDELAVVMYLTSDEE